MTKDLEPKNSKGIRPKGINEEKSFQYPKTKTNKNFAAAACIVVQFFISTFDGK